MKRLFKQLAVAASLAVSVMSVQATIVNNWSYGLSSLFSAASPPGVTGVGTSTLSWGTSTGSGQSSLAIGNNPIVGGLVTTFVGGGAIPPAFWAPANTITHNNNPITGLALTSAVLTSSLNLVALMPAANPPGTPGALPPLIVNIGFSETPNQTPCVVIPSPTPCNDIFVLTGGLLNQMFSYDVDGTGAVNYFLNVFPSTGGVLSTLTALECAAAGQGAGCIGFTTPENQSTTLGFSFTISAQPFVIPEPGSLALAAVALLAAWLIRRRRYES